MEPVADGSDQQGANRGRSRTTRSMRARLRSDQQGRAAPKPAGQSRKASSGRAENSRGNSPTQSRNASAERAGSRQAKSTAQSRDASVGRSEKRRANSTGGPDDPRRSPELNIATPSMRRDTTGLDLADDDVFGNLGDSFADGDIPEAPPSAAPSAASSSATPSHVERRPRSRQSSFVGRSDPPIRPSSRGGNPPGVSSSFNIGVFRRRAREPSILGTARRARSRTGSVAASVNSSRAGSVVWDSELESEAEFAPELESTPLNNRRPSRPSRQPVERLESPPELRRRSLRKRKSRDELEYDKDGPEKMTRVESTGGLDMNSDSELSELSSPSPPPPLPPPPAVSRFPARAVTPMNMDEITAPPASSDSEADHGNLGPDIRSLAKRRRRLSTTTPLRNDGNFSDVSSPPSLTHSPDLVATRGRSANRKHRQSPKITTADLTNLLPKRRCKRTRDELDLDSEGHDETDEGDEPSYRDARPGRRKGNSRPSSRAGQLGANGVLKARQTVVPVRRSARAAGKTYRHRREDKENEENGSEGEGEGDNSRFQPLPDDTFDTASMAADVQNADELKKATKKFREVDQWELSFEEVAEPPSPQGAR